MLVGYPPSPDQVHPNPFFVSKLLTSTFRASLDFLRTSMTVALQAMESWQLRPLSRLTSSEISALRSHFAWHPDGSMGYHKTIGFPVKMTRACDADSLGSPILGELLGSWGSFFEAHPHWRLQGNHTRTDDPMAVPVLWMLLGQRPEYQESLPAWGVGRPSVAASKFKLVMSVGLWVGNTLANPAKTRQPWHSEWSRV